MREAEMTLGEGKIVELNGCSGRIEVAGESTHIQFILARRRTPANVGGHIEFRPLGNSPRAKVGDIVLFECKEQSRPNYATKWGLTADVGR